LALADIVMAPSLFVRDSLIYAGISEARIKVIPWGAPPVANGYHDVKRRPFVFLSAGKQSVAKGTHLLLDAWRRLRPGKNVELWMVGRMSLPATALEDLPGTVVIRPAVPREELYEIYRKASVLVLPTLCEGFALVITEAMAHGVPVITTSNSGAVGYLKTGEDGFIIPTKDTDRLAEKMQWCLDHPDDLSEIAHRALARANDWQWSDYRRELGRTISEFLASRRN
jgi:glycosyltransferase involved in cell wall biosynthesis